jgi:hypothetical protein
MKLYHFIAAIFISFVAGMLITLLFVTGHKYNQEQIFCEPIYSKEKKEYLQKRDSWIENCAQKSMGWQSCPIRGECIFHEYDYNLKYQRCAESFDSNNEEP